MTVVQFFRRCFKFFRCQPVLLFVICLTCLIEIGIFLAEIQVIPVPRLRAVTLEYGAFWRGLLDNWRPNFGLQPLTMFFTYTILHAGIGHLVGNLVTLVVVSQQVLSRMSQKAFAWLFLVSAFSGAVAFGLLSNRLLPMVGTSGAIFGVVGAWYFYYSTEDYAANKSWWRSAVILVALVLVNVGMFYWTDGRLAWETHLGGFVAGVLFVLIKERRVDL